MYLLFLLFFVFFIFLLIVSAIGTTIARLVAGVRNLFGFKSKRSASRDADGTYLDGKGKTRQKIIGDHEGEYVDFEEINE